jgi:hypothetical protein
MKYKIPLDLKLGCKSVWSDRMPDVINMIGQGLKLKDIGNHYGCTPENVSKAMKVEGYGSIHYVRASFRRVEL